MLGCAHKSVSAKNKKMILLYPTEQCQTVERLDVELCSSGASPPTIQRAQSQKSLFASDFALKYLLTFSSEETRRLKSEQNLNHQPFAYLLRSSRPPIWHGLHHSLLICLLNSGIEQFNAEAVRSPVGWLPWDGAWWMGSPSLTFPFQSHTCVFVRARLCSVICSRCPTDFFTHTADHAQFQSASVSQTCCDCSVL